MPIQNLPEPENVTLISCRICLGGARTRIFLPCRHFCACNNCASIILPGPCPVCRGKVEGTIEGHVPENEPAIRHRCHGCEANDANVLMKDCGHIATCNECFMENKDHKCLYCGVINTETLPIFWG